MYRAQLALALMAGAISCGDDPGPDLFPEDDWDIVFADEPTDALADDEIAARAAYRASPVAVHGRLLDPDGAPVVGAVIRMAGAAATTTSDGNGEFVLTGLHRHNRALHVEAAGFRPEQLFPHMAVPITQATVELAPLWLVPTRTDTTRFLFAGDVALGRRYLDPDDSTPRGQMPPDDPTALIRVADPVPGSLGVVQYIEDVFADADYRVVNLETVVTDDPATPHPTKAYCFFTLPESLVALHALGLTYVGVGNNHLYDYLAGGVTDTLANLDAEAIAHSGAGASPAEAFAPHHVELGGSPYAMVSMSGVSGVEHEIHYVADATQGGAADLRDDDTVMATIGAERAEGRVVIAMLHQGQEYTYEPSPYAKDRLAFVAEAGANLIVSHHPHVAQGFGYAGDVLQIHSLGNFAFDSERLETLWSMIARVDMRDGQAVGVDALPIYLEDYRPRVMTSSTSDVLFRRLGEFSTPYGADARIEGGRLRVTPQGVGWRDDDTTISVDVTVPASGQLIVDLRPLAPSSASLRSVQAAAGLTAQVGRDLLQFGTFEDADVDELTLETARWDVTGSYSYPCLSEAWRGAVALCLRGTGGQRSATAVALRNRVRVMGDATDTPIKDLTLFGYMQLRDAGAITIRADYSPSEGSADLGSEVAFTSPGGTAAWAPFEAALHMPADVEPTGPTTNPRAVRIFLRAEAPTAEQAMARFDDLAIIGWEDAVDLTGATPLATPHARDFVRLQAPPGTYTLQLTFRTSVRDVAP